MPEGISKPKKINFRNFELVQTKNVPTGLCYGEFLIRNCGDTFGAIRMNLEGFDLWFHGLCIARGMPSLKEALTKAHEAFWDRELNWNKK